MITDEQRRARLAERHRLLPQSRTDDLAAVADAVIGLHSSDPVTVYLSALARMRHPSLAAVDRALYEHKSLIRHHAMRRTLWVATPTVVRLMNAGATRALVGPDRRRTVKLLDASGISGPEHWLDEADALVLADLHEHGPSTARDLGRRIPQLQLPLSMAPGTTYAATPAAHTRVILGLGFQGEILRVRPTGSWVNGAYRYSVAGDWLAGGLGGMESRPAAAELAELWLRRFGPATAVDLQWWMGWTGATTARALADAAAVEVDLLTGPGWMSAADQELPETEPWVAALPSLDPTTMGWKQRDWYLPAAAAEAFDRNGNAGPTLWVDGRVVGAWAQTKAGEFRTHYFERVAAARRAEIDERMAIIAEAVGDTRFTIRFPGRIQATILTDTL